MRSIRIGHPPSSTTANNAGQVIARRLRLGGRDDLSRNLQGSALSFPQIARRLLRRATPPLRTRGRTRWRCMMFPSLAVYMLSASVPSNLTASPHASFRGEASASCSGKLLGALQWSTISSAGFGARTAGSGIGCRSNLLFEQRRISL